MTRRKKRKKGKGQLGTQRQTLVGIVEDEG